MKLGSTDAFGTQYLGSALVDPYVDGVSITRGPPSDDEHAFTYVVSLFEALVGEVYACPCRGGRAAPGYVGDAFACATSDENVPSWQSDDELFRARTDAGCDALPEDDFVAVDLGAARDAPVHLRLMTDEAPWTEDVALRRVEVWVR